MIDAKARVVVTGANGFVGRALIHRLSEIGCEVRAVARSKRRARAFAANYNAKLTLADICNEQAMEGAFNDATHVFHLAAAFRNPGISDSEFQRVNVTGTKTVARLAARQPDLERFVHVSAADVHGPSIGLPADELTPCNPSTAYERTKLAGENWLASFAAEKNLPHAIIRPCTIYGPGDRRMLRLFRLINFPITIIPGAANNHRQLAHVEDLTQVLLTSATHPDALNQTFIYGDQQALTLREINSCISRHSGRRNKLKVVPLKPAEWLAKTSEYVSEKLNVDSPISVRDLAFFNERRVFSTQKIDAAFELRLNWNSNPQAGLVATYDWYKEQQWL